MQVMHKFVLVYPSIVKTFGFLKIFGFFMHVLGNFEYFDRSTFWEKGGNLFTFFKCQYLRQNCMGK
jgi:hypothetical protein